MTNYAGHYAELYDLFYADKPYAVEASFIHDCIQEFGLRQTRAVIELACGTGRHALELEKLGYQITATDGSLDMIEIARRRAGQNGSEVVFLVAEMQNLELPAKQYDAALCLFDSIGYLKTNHALQHTLAKVWKYLAPGGVFIFEFWHAPAMLNHYSPMRIRKLKTADGEISRTSETTLDRVNRLAVVNYTVHQRTHDGNHSTLRESHTNRFFSVDEMKTLVSRANLEPVKFFAGFNKTDPITDETWHIVAVTQKS